MAYYQWLSIFLAAFSLFVLRGSSQGGCPNNWIHIQGSCYKISSKAVSWNAAKSACEALGSTLSIIKSQAEQQALGPKITHETWIGLHRDPKDKSRWMWVDGTQATYTAWGNGEPNNVGEECGEIRPQSRWKWNDHECYHAHPYVCETSVKRQKLSLPSGVRVSPSHCLSSKQRPGSTCTFSCARGYRLSGPSSTQCGKRGFWSRQVNSVGCRVVKCPALTVSRLVKPSPNSCVTSQMKFNNKCSFTCSQGYQLQGLSYKQCGADGRWSDSAKAVSCIVVKCLALTVSRLVKTSPNSCVTSQMKVNTKCSFTCPQGHQLQGPSYKQCGAGGRWSDSAKAVSCIDIDECSISKNGGCSHKCVNTAGGCKCECPDPELSLSSDNRTCHGSSAAFMTALFMMCVACLVGTALMAFKKSRDEPIGYTVLATGDQK